MAKKKSKEKEKKRKKNPSGDVTQVQAKHVLNALTNIERWCGAVREVFEDIPPDQVIYSKKSSLEATGDEPPTEELNIRRNCPPPDVWPE